MRYEVTVLLTFLVDAQDTSFIPVLIKDRFKGMPWIDSWRTYSLVEVHDED